MPNMDGVIHFTLSQFFVLRLKSSGRQSWSAFGLYVQAWSACGMFLHNSKLAVVNLVNYVGNTDQDQHKSFLL